MNKAIFLDRDGILIEDVSYPHKLEDLHIKEDIIPHLKWAIDQGFLLVIVTNQAGIAKGKFKLEDYNKFQSKLTEELKYRGIEITRTYFCPYHIDGTVKPYNIESLDRKPEAGMFFKAEKELNIDLSQSFMIGDKFSDNINHSSLKCYILSSRYTIDQNGTYNSFDEIFKEIKSEIR